MSCQGLPPSEGGKVESVPEAGVFSDALPGVAHSPAEYKTPHTDTAEYLLEEGGKERAGRREEGLSLTLRVTLLSMSEMGSSPSAQVHSLPSASLSLRWSKKARVCFISIASFSQASSNIPNSLFWCMRVSMLHARRRWKVFLRV